MLFTIYMTILVVLLFVFLWKRKQFKHNYPPGLPVLPVIGSMLHLGWNKLLHFEIQEKAKKYGPIYTGKLGNDNVVFMTGADVVMAALRKDEFQGRPNSFTILQRSGEGHKKSLGIFFSDGPQWNNTRKFAMRQLKSFGSSQLEQFMTTEVNALVDSIKDGSLMEMTGLFVLSSINVIWLIIANKTFQPEDENIRVFISENKSFFRGGNPAGSMTDMFPLLRYVDKRYQERMEHIGYVKRMIKDLIEEHKKVLDPNSPFDLIDNYLVELQKVEENNKESDFSEDDLILTCFDLFSAGAEPTSAALDFVLLYMALYPEVQSKMQEEIDTVVARARKPTLEDRQRMPYTMAVLNEVARINPTAPIAVPHRCTKSTVFNDFYIEKGSMIFLDLYSVGYDPKYWDEPEKFLPERFLDNEGNLKKVVAFTPFSLGQRACAGETLVKTILFLFIATFFEKYSISLPKGSPKPSTDVLPGFTVGCRPFKAVIKSRY